ncbi:MAG: FAD-dependent oxidoreductase [Deltaproteobacteria bacterium]|nr:FAD-dependent oxidoreductase [Deltaproteobacteria bacterium]MDX9763248.1 FAD-dependent oxidoreductase [Desulfomonilia bacterium]
MNNSLLMQGFSLKGLWLRNRIAMAPMLSRLCNTDGSVSQKLIDYYVERAKGGAGLIIVEYCYIDQNESKARHGQLGVYHDRFIAGLAELAEAIQECGAKTILQICHAGRSSSAKFTGLKPIAPSAIPNYANEKPREMSEEEIESIVQAFAEAAYRARAAGFDGVEIHGGHGYLIAQFLSPYTNIRQDRYGHDRGLFGLQVLDRVRSRVGRDYVVGYRISGDEFMQGGLTAEDAQEFSVRLERQGVDYIHVSGGSAETGQDIVIPVYFSQGHLLHLAQGIKQKVHVPVIAVGAIHDTRLAEDALQSGKADLIAMGRALIADPALPDKIRTGRLDDICPCLRCNEGCRSRMMEDKAQRCAVNAEAGRERLMRIRPASKSKRVCIIGGGPAGLEAARTLSLRGHRVTLLEQKDRLGGLLRYASVPEFKSEMRRFLEYLIRQVNALKVDVRYRCRATIDMVKEMRPDAVVLATGSQPLIPQIPGVDQPFVTSALDLLSGNLQPGKRVLIAGGAAMGCEIAAHLAGQGREREVILLEMRSEIALDLEPRARIALISLLKQGKVEILKGWKLEQIGDGEVAVLDGGQNRKTIKGDALILATGFTPDQDLIQPLMENFSEIHVIGDCLKPRKIYQAIHEGAYAGRAI